MSEVDDAIGWLMDKTELDTNGFQLREILAEQGIEVTPDEMKACLIEAALRIGSGVCKRCGKGDENTELRYGVCFECMMKEPEPKE